MTTLHFWKQFLFYRLYDRVLPPPLALSSPSVGKGDWIRCDERGSPQNEFRRRRGRIEKLAAETFCESRNKLAARQAVYLWWIVRFHDSRERRVLRLEEAPVLFDGGSRRRRIAEAAGDVVVWRGAVSLEWGHQRREPGLGDTEARVDHRAPHRQFWKNCNDSEAIVNSFCSASNFEKSWESVTVPIDQSCNSTRLTMISLESFITTLAGFRNRAFQIPHLTNTSAPNLLCGILAPSEYSCTSCSSAPYSALKNGDQPIGTAMNGKVVFTCSRVRRVWGCEWWIG